VKQHKLEGAGGAIEITDIITKERAQRSTRNCIQKDNSGSELIFKRSSNLNCAISCHSHSQLEAKARKLSNKIDVKCAGKAINSPWLNNGASCLCIFA